MESDRCVIHVRAKAVEKGSFTQGAEMGIDGDGKRGNVWYKKLRSEERAITKFRRTHSTSSELVYTGEIVPGWNEDFTALWSEALDEANLREQEKRAALQFQCFHILSWNVA